MYHNLFSTALTYWLKILSLSVLYTLSASLWLKHPLSIPNSIMFLKIFKPLLKTSRRFGGFSLMFYWIFITVADTHTAREYPAGRTQLCVVVAILSLKTLTRGFEVGKRDNLLIEYKYKAHPFVPFLKDIAQVKTSVTPQANTSKTNAF
jgi:hypothetical protein